MAASGAGLQPLRIYGLQSGEGRWAYIICVGEHVWGLEPKVVQVTEGFVREDGSLAFFENNVLLFIPHLCWKLRIFPAL